jgi:hypothetical protein
MMIFLQKIEVSLGFANNNECCNMQQNIGWLRYLLMNLVVVVGFFMVLQITNNITKKMMISST